MVVTGNNSSENLENCKKDFEEITTLKIMNITKIIEHTNIKPEAMAKDIKNLPGS